jgi:hypothetical protein
VDTINVMAQNGLDATAVAEVRGFVKENKLLEVASVDAIVKEGKVVGRQPRHRLATAGADPLPDEPLTEYGYARRFIEVYGGELRFLGLSAPAAPAKRGAAGRELDPARPLPSRTTSL